MTLPPTESLLSRLGWDDGWEAAFAAHRAAGLVPARVAIQHRGAYDLATEQGEVRARAASHFVRDDDLPGVGDWVGLDLASGLVEALLERRTSISRKEVWNATREQILAANVDIAFLVQALPLDFNARRLERYLAMAWESGAQPVVLLTKTDLVDDIAPYLVDAEAVTLGACPVATVSARTGDGLEELRAWFEGNRTAVLLGSSGVGKSTIVNALVGEQVLATQEVREDDQRGRHTTSHRELILLPTGGIVLDTPGIRELQLWDADLEQTFSDVEEVARRCRFADCAHDREPGCAIRDALADGSLPPERWQSYSKLQHELEAVEAKRNKIRAGQNRPKKKG
ncbi:MAG TPA: ribosome small subunit-dependent GTPase A [Gaiellaceae bacterium]|nr:ribosome small subunit-dependent GTPase A [Gaiellaceae bacterium]